MDEGHFKNHIGYLRIPGAMVEFWFRIQKVSGSNTFCNNILHNLYPNSLNPLKYSVRK